MNLAIYPHDSEEIVFFLLNARKTGPHDYAGDNLRLAGMKPQLWAFLWTDDATEPIRNVEGDIIGWNKRVSDLAPCPEYFGSPCGSHQEVEAINASCVASFFSPAEEAKIQRRAIMSIMEKLAVTPSAEWTQYIEAVEGIIQEGKAVKLALSK